MLLFHVKEGVGNEKNVNYSSSMMCASSGDCELETELESELEECDF